jgi:hypothetical protein
MSNLYGYVTTYTQNSDGTYTCSLTSYAPLLSSRFITPSISNIPITTNVSTNIIKKTITCIGILNSNIIISPNSPAQMIIMSSDNKYIFIPLTDNRLTNSNSIINYQLSVYAILKYNSNISLINNYSELNSYVNASSFSLSDATYNSITDRSLKTYYGIYLTGINPPVALLNINPNLNQWSDIGYFYIAMYLHSVNKDDQKLLPKNICIITDSPTVHPAVSNIDCRNVPNGAPYVLLDNSQNGQNCGSSSSCSSSFCILLCIGLLILSGVQIASSIDKSR